MINCSPMYYGAGNRQVGMALVLNGQPGQACDSGGTVELVVDVNGYFK